MRFTSTWIKKCTCSKDNVISVAYASASAAVVVVSVSVA